MKTALKISLAVLIAGVVIEGCQQSGAKAPAPAAEVGMVIGRATNSKGAPLKNVNIVLSHTVWSDKKLFASTDENGNYSVTLPAEPRGNWTIQAKYNTVAYGQEYTFVLDANDNRSFGGVRGAIRNFTWKLLGEHIGGQYGAEVDVFASDKQIDLKEVKLIFSPLEELLVDGTEAKSLEKNLTLIDGQYRAGFIPVGKYAVQAIYKGKVLKLASNEKDRNMSESLELNFQADGPTDAAAFRAEIFVTL